ncbi:cell surface glycoprotein CD200 receptor 1-A-like [Sinocyclocheilus rhinocerous]|uniref:cell surface glycoprotein CD200 receptor 1-A-like n=1 Tax=Sinocyclocheilus rhinocerous TaxID=307959 RepID=UPI0007BA0023|nr:PREDICTED: cell surface glycoprotein CD200 receptor 1-A-like [Sinocyclocheilus rhinocerous]
MANSWTLTVVVLLSIFMARSQTRGDQDTGSHQNPASAVKKLTVFQEQTFISGSDVTLRCDNLTVVKWNELIYIIWNISQQDRTCWLGLSPKLDDTCNDGKKLYNTSDGVSLVIPKISIEDEGFYFCDVSYKGGSSALNVTVSVINVSTKQYRENNQRIAVCNSTYKKKAPTLHWEPALNFPSNISSVKKLGKFFMVKNQIYLPENVNISELTCVATYTSESGSVQHKSTLYLTDSQNSNPSSPWTNIAISVGSVCFVLVALLAVYKLRRKFYDISALKMLCCKSKISTPVEDKPPQPADVEEVEPYASYVQRVNSIYNSSAELFNA